MSPAASARWKSEKRLQFLFERAWDRGLSKRTKLRLRLGLAEHVRPDRPLAGQVKRTGRFKPYTPKARPQGGRLQRWLASPKRNKRRSGTTT